LLDHRSMIGVPTMDSSGFLACWDFFRAHPPLGNGNTIPQVAEHAFVMP